MKHDEKPEKPEAVSEEWKRKLKRAWILCGLLVLVLAVGLGIYFGWPLLFKARETSARNPCQENQMKIDSAVQQYILEYGLNDQAEFVALFGTEQKDWSPVLIGENRFIRYEPKCPAHESPAFWKFWRWGEPINDYSIANNSMAAWPVRCNVGMERHPYPGGGDDDVDPTPTPTPAADGS
ncbi:hypothetical protein KQI84_13120 [bacterium]|nr:hypothetical protein [bacterium]